MEIVSFRASGFRSLANIEEIPIGEPTILTGSNDGGKTAAIGALHFLLNGPQPSTDDYTMARDEDDPPQGIHDGRFTEISVTGRFTLSEAEREQLGFPQEILIRRKARLEATASFELFTSVPKDERLRQLSEKLPLAELQDRAAALGVEPTGKKGAKISFLEPLRELAGREETVDEWVPAPLEIVSRLPRFVHFASTTEPDPEHEIRATLTAVYRGLIEDDDLMRPVREAERAIQDELRSDADALRDHIRLRCPELVDVEIEPDVSFSGGFRGVTLRAGKGEDRGVTLGASGAGRRRRVTLAVWEWSTDLLAGSDDRCVVIAYDEPDTHLDYGHQRKLVDLIRTQAALPGTRVVIATHSLNLIDKVDIEDVIHLTLDAERTVVHRLAGDEHSEIDRYLADIAVEMGLRNSVLLHERCFVGVEGSTEMQAFPSLFHAATGHRLQSVGIALIAGNNNVGALRVAKFLNEHGRKVQFVVDQDSSTTAGNGKVFRPDALKAQGIASDQIHLIGDPNEFEELFSDEQWATTANEAWPRDDGQPWMPGDFAVLRKEKSFSKSLTETVRNASSLAPPGKPGYVLALARRVKSADEIPSQLREVFSKLMTMAESN